MRFRCLTSFLIICACTSLSAAQDSISRVLVRDSRGLEVLRHAVESGGGVQAIAAFRSYSAFGDITFFWTEAGTDGDVTLKARWPGQFRMDIHLSDGTEQWVFIKHGAGFKKEVNGETRPLLYQEVVNLQSYCFPLEQLVRALQNSDIEVGYGGTATREGRLTFVVRVQTAPGFPASKDTRRKLSEKKYYIDARTYKIVSVEDFAYPRRWIADGIRRRIVFSDYRQVQGAWLPFSISEIAGKDRRLLTIRLNEASINVPLSDSDFEP